jgi:hypothetical protein
MGIDHACALLSGGGVDCWGDNTYGELGNGTTTSSNSPVAVSGISDATQISAGSYSTCALLSTGSIDCWGHDYYGELGNGITHTDSQIPVAVSGITNAAEITEGDDYSCALLSTGSIDCWGWNQFGELGDGLNTDSAVPVAVSGITDARQTSAGLYAACAVLTDSSVHCWGDNGDGALGNGTTTASNVPVTVSGL